MRDEYRRSGPVSDLTTTAISASGLFLLLWSVAEPLVLFVIGSPTIFQARYIVGYVTIVPSCLGLMWGGRRIRRSDIPAEHYEKITLYWMLGGGGFLAFNVGLMVFFPTGSVWIVANWVRWALSLGLAIGLYVGIGQSRAIFNTLTAERQTLRAEHVEKQRDLVDQMNGILRHEILNSTQVIVGNASSLLESTDPIEPSDERIERIYRQGEEVTEVIQEVRSLLAAIEDNRKFEPIDLTETIRAEVRKIEDRYADIDVDLRLRGDVYVRGDELLGRVFGNVLGNAAQHNDTESLRITVEVETLAQSVVVRIRDNGGGIPERTVEGLFDRPDVGDHGLGLHIVRELTNSYRGTIDLVQTGSDGTTFEIRFPIADTTPERSSEPTAPAR